MSAPNDRGDRVRLVRCSDPYTRLVPGEEGTVQHVDSLGTIHVKWDSGSSLGLVPEAGDDWQTITRHDDECRQCGVEYAKHPAGDGLAVCPGDFGSA